MPSTLHVSPVEGLDDSGEQLPSVESQSQPFLVVGGPVAPGLLFPGRLSERSKPVYSVFLSEEATRS